MKNGVVCTPFQRQGPHTLVRALADGYAVFAHRFTVSIVRRGWVIICRPPAMGQALAMRQALAIRVYEFCALAWSPKGPGHPAVRNSVSFRGKWLPSGDLGGLLPISIG